MITVREWRNAVNWAWNFLLETGLPLRPEEKNNIEIADCGLSNFDTVGLHILTLCSTEWLGSKLLILKPGQFFPQHRHPPSLDGSYPGKTEYLRGQYGEAFLYVPGSRRGESHYKPPTEYLEYLTVWEEHSLEPGRDYLCPPNVWHWFAAGPSGAVIWSISSKVTDAADQFFDPRIKRKTEITET